MTVYGYPPVQLCMTCGKRKLVIDAFWHKSKSCKSGFAVRCKECVGDKPKVYSYPERQQRYRETHREAFREYCKRSRVNNRTHSREIWKAQQIRWRLANPERHKIITQLASARRRARLKGAGGAGFTEDDRRLQLKSQGGNCWWCGKPMGDDVTIEHVRPIVRGGMHDPRNIVMAHKSCNSSKGTKLPHEWNGRLL